MGFNTINFMEGYVLGENNNNKESDILKIDMLPTWGEVIIDDEYSVKIKKSDEIATTDRFTISDTYSTSPYLHTYERTWTIYYCAYRGSQLLFGQSGITQTSQQWSWSMWNSNEPWLNVYCGHKYLQINKITVEKLPIYDGCSGLDINFNYDLAWFSRIYNIDGIIEQEIDGTPYNDSSGSIIGVSQGGMAAKFYTKDNYQARAEDTIAFGQAVAKSNEFKCII